MHKGHVPTKELKALKAIVGYYAIYSILILLGFSNKH